jgi:hypothetical protein
MNALRDVRLERHSLVADPLFADFAARDFTLSPDSPAFSLGFNPIDMSNVGPRPQSQRSGL